MPAWGERGVRGPGGRNVGEATPPPGHPPNPASPLGLCAALAIVGSSLAKHTNVTCPAPPAFPRDEERLPLLLCLVLHCQQHPQIDQTVA